VPRNQHQQELLKWCSSTKHDSATVSGTNDDQSIRSLGDPRHLGASVIALSFPKAEANERPVLAKSDRFAVSSSAQSCDGQTWPNIATACLHNADSETTIVDARLVTAPRSQANPDK
jgi:hypothetical protein